MNWQGWARLFAGVSAIYIAAIIFSDPSKVGTSSSDTKPRSDKCKKDLQCWAQKNRHLTTQCREAIERLTTSDFRWTDSLTESKFDNFRWHNAAGLTVTYSGDKILVQNTYGAHMRMTYECDIDPIGETILGVRLFPGRIAQ